MNNEAEEGHMLTLPYLILTVAVKHKYRYEQHFCELGKTYIAHILQKFQFLLGILFS